MRSPLRTLSAEDKSRLEGTLHQLERVHDELLAQVFAALTMRVVWLMLSLLLVGSLSLRAVAQVQEPALSDGEVEKLRESAADAPGRVGVFVEIINRRADRIEKLSIGKRQPGREDDLHTSMQEMASILDDLEDNLDDYAKRHWDVRKSLPRLIAATERWGTILKSAPEVEDYRVARKLALESLGDVHESAVKMVDEQKAWFKDHPPTKTDGRPE